MIGVGIMGGSVSPARLRALELRQAENTLRDVIGRGAAAHGLIDGFVDTFVDETGLDLGNCTDQTYDGVGDYYTGLGYGSSVVAVMASDTDAGQVASASPAPLNAAYNLFTKTASYFQWNSGTTTGSVTIQLATAHVVTKYSLFPYTGELIRAFKNWTVEGSNDGASWTTLDTRSNVTGWAADGTGLEFTFSNSTAFSYYRITVTANNGNANWTTMTQWNLFELAGRAMTLQGASFAAVSVPSVGQQVFLWEDLDGGSALNVDFIALMSRDGGATWAQVNLNDEGGFDGAVHIVSSDAIDLSGQPVGQNVAWKAVTTAKEQRLHGVWNQWR